MATEKKITPTTVNEEIDAVSLQFEGILSSLSTFRTQITALQQQLRGLEKTVKK